MLVPVERIERTILLLRGQKVMLDRDLAVLYGVKPIALRQQVRRNPSRFPLDFMFQLSREEADLLVSHNVIPSLRSLGGSLPYAFTQEGVAMLSSVLRSRRAVATPTLAASATRAPVTEDRPGIRRPHRRARSDRARNPRATRTARSPVLLGQDSR